MSDDKKQGEVHELAGGWITERKGTPVPGFLKLSYVVFCAFGLCYLFLYTSGETTHATRGALVQQFNQVTGSLATPFLGLLTLVLIGFIVGLLAFAFRGQEDGE